jgi:hypothetical protein
MRSWVLIILVIGAIVLFSTDIWSKWLAWISFISAAVVVALQSFVASFVAYIYIRMFNMFEVHDIIKIHWSGIWTSGEVSKIGLFFTSLKEMDAHMMYTDAIIEIPNYLIFNNGISNHTKKNHLFRSEYIYYILPKYDSATEDFEQFCTIVSHSYQQTLKDPLYHLAINADVFENKPQYELSISTTWLQCKVRLFVHLHKLIYTNNTINCALIDAHRWERIKLVQHQKNVL